MVALAKGRQNVGFLVVLGIAGAIAVLIAARLPRLSRQGKAYLDRLAPRIRGLAGPDRRFSGSGCRPRRGHGDRPPWPAGSGRHTTAGDLATADAQG